VGALAAGAGLVALASLGLPRVGGLAEATPRRTSWMRARQAEARRQGRPYRVDHRWVPYAAISPHLRRAVLIAEDDAFFAHGGLDWNEIRSAARANLERGRIVRGGSTITQQLAKNLYLAGERTALRKIREILLARRLERELSKRRIFELYLNLIEWGDGIFGVEAAARRSFGVAAAELDPRQAALLAAVIINPRRYSPAEPSRRIERRARMILGRMFRRGHLTEGEYRVALAERPASGLDWLLRSTRAAAGHRPGDRGGRARLVRGRRGRAAPGGHAGRRHAGRGIAGLDRHALSGFSPVSGKVGQLPVPGVASAWRTRRATVPPSARPLTWGMTAPITLPASLAEVAPTRPMASRISASSSASVSA
jgi:monofunctional biosynthetic peptidoglycan transglycosylase